MTPQHPLFVAIDNLLGEPLSIKDLVLTRALSEIRETVAQEKRRRGELGFDDMLSRLDTALRSESGEALAAAIRTRFPVAMIDEFQDTDPQQYRIFRRIWRHQPDTALLLIGDPKQAIYAFRGADIFTYMKARSEVSAHYTLDTNWRSAPGMVNSVNKLFSQMNDAFMFRDIPFSPVKFAPRNQSLQFKVNDAPQPAMTLWLMEGKAAVRAIIKVIWRRCAPRKSRLAACRANGRRAADERRFVAARSCLGYQRVGAQQAGSRADTGCADLTGDPLRLSF